MKKMRPLEHHLCLGRDLHVADLDRRFLERKIRRIHEQTPGDEVELPRFQITHRCLRAVPEPLVKNRMTVVERVEQAVGTRIVPAKFPVEGAWQIELFVSGGPLS